MSLTKSIVARWFSRLTPSGSTGRGWGRPGCETPCPGSARARSRRRSGGAAGGALARREHHEARQVFRFRAQAIERPGAERGPAGNDRAGEQQQLPRMVVEGVGMDRAHQADVVGDLAQVLPQLGEHHAGLPARRKVVAAGHHLGGRLDKSELEVFGHFGRQRFAVPLLELGLGVEELVLARPPLHKHVDDVLSLGREVRRARRQRIVLARRSGGKAVGRQQVAERPHADAVGGAAQEGSARAKCLESFESHGVRRGLMLAAAEAQRATNQPLSRSGLL